ncbi:MAG: lytic transglycosylase domain-containing protein [Woeseiaceae bacterium]
MPKIHLLRWLILLVASLSLLLPQMVQARAYLYQMPDGTRLLSDHPLINTKAKLVRRSDDLTNMGHYVARRTLRAKKQMKVLAKIIFHQSRKYNVDESLVKAVIFTESYFNPHATSKKGASGLMQLMPMTAEKYGVSDLYNPKQNIVAGIKHLKYLLELYPKNLKHAIAAYNAGENAVKKYKGIPPYKETQRYVKKVMKHFKRFQLASR